MLRHDADYTRLPLFRWRRCRRREPLMPLLLDAERLLMLSMARLLYAMLFAR